MSNTTGPVGEMTARAAYELLRGEPEAALVDVRTAAEWAFVGVPDLSDFGKDVIFAEWQSFPSSQVAPGFAAALAARLAAQGAPTSAALLFICRSGVRCLAAARAMSVLGFSQCINVAGGFEGPCDASRHRGGLDGWKALGLPWLQN